MFIAYFVMLFIHRLGAARWTSWVFFIKYHKNE